MLYHIVHSPVGDLLLRGDGGALCAIEFLDAPFVPSPDWVHTPSVFERWARDLAAYFDGRPPTWDGPLALRGTPFQVRVWNELCHVPFGTTISYGELAKRIGAPKAVRAVGLANGRNPLPIVIPCHRVIGADGSLTGYGGGLERKRFLLQLEGVRLAQPSQLSLTIAERVGG